jgi:hypothetical protein
MHHARKLPDRTERTSLRKRGVSDVFRYVARLPGREMMAARAGRLNCQMMTERRPGAAAAVAAAREVRAVGICLLVKEVTIANPYKYLHFLDNVDPGIDGQARGRREARNLRN